MYVRESHFVIREKIHMSEKYSVIYYLTILHKITLIHKYVYVTDVWVWRFNESLLFQNISPGKFSLIACYLNSTVHFSIHKT